MSKRPNLFVIGSARSGTTSLHLYLTQHPQIWMSQVKEPRFFALRGQPIDFRGPGDQRIARDSVTDRCAYEALFEGAGEARVLGEASTLYFDSDRAADGIREACPEAKFLVLLRQPAERAYSAFMHHLGQGLEPEQDFGRALASEASRVEAGWYQAWQYRSRGFYYPRLRRYLDRFSGERLRVFLYDDLRDRPRWLMRQIFEFLEVDDSYVADIRARHNASGLPRAPRLQRVFSRRHRFKEALKVVVPDQFGHRVMSKLSGYNLRRPEIPQAVRRELNAGYLEDIQKTSELIERDLSHWM